MSDVGVDATTADWPLFDLRLECGDVLLRLIRETDLSALATMQPPDYEHDPRSEQWAGEDLVSHRRRLLLQGYWRSLGTWSPSSWCLDFAVEHAGALVGVQSLEGESFADVRTVDSGSWLAQGARGQGVGAAMRRAVLAVAFDHLGRSPQCRQHVVTTSLRSPSRGVWAIGTMA